MEQENKKHIIVVRFRKGRENRQKYLNPWIAKVINDWQPGNVEPPSLQYGDEKICGDDRGIYLEIGAYAGDILYCGQKDVYGRIVESFFGKVRKNGSLERLHTVKR